MWIDDTTCIQYDQDLLNFEPATAADLDRGASRGDGAVRFNDRHAHAFALRQVGPESGLLLERLEPELPMRHTFRHFEAPLERIPSARNSHLVDEDLGHETELVGARCAMRR